MAVCPPVMAVCSGFSCSGCACRGGLGGRGGREFQGRDRTWRISKSHSQMAEAEAEAEADIEILSLSKDASALGQSGQSERAPRVPRERGVTYRKHRRVFL